MVEQVARACGPLGVMAGLSAHCSRGPGKPGRALSREQGGNEAPGVQSAVRLRG